MIRLAPSEHRNLVVYHYGPEWKTLTCFKTLIPLGSKYLLRGPLIPVPALYFVRDQTSHRALPCFPSLLCCAIVFQILQRDSVIVSLLESSPKRDCLLSFLAVCNGTNGSHETSKLKTLKLMLTYCGFSEEESHIICILLAEHESTIDAPKVLESALL